MIPTNLDKKISFVKAKSGGPFNSNSYEIVYECRANLLSLTNNENYANGMTTEDVVYSFRTLATNFTRSLLEATKGYLVSYKDNKYNIISAVPYKTFYVDVKAKRVI